MNKNILYNVSILLLFVIGIVINHFFEDMKVFGMACILLMAVLGIMKEKLISKRNDSRRSF